MEIGNKDYIFSPRWQSPHFAGECKWNNSERKAEGHDERDCDQFGPRGLHYTVKSGQKVGKMYIKCVSKIHCWRRNLGSLVTSWYSAVKLSGFICQKVKIC